MISYLQNSKLDFEPKNNFNNYNYPCYFIKNEFGYVVFFMNQKDVVDFGVYTKAKKMITYIPNINFLLKNDSISSFISESINNYIKFLIDRSKK